MRRRPAACQAAVLSAAVGVLTLSAPEATAQSRIDFHLLPAVSTGPLDPDWSPDAARLAFAMRGDVWVMPVAGGTAKALTRGPHYYSEPAFSPDGERIALTVDRDGNLDVGVVDAGGGEIRILTDDGDDDFAPEWSRDGKYVYFASRRAGNLDILRVDVDGGGVEAVVFGPGNQYQPAVSPDGRTLAYVGSVDGRIGSGGIWTMPLPGGSPKLVHYEESSYRMKPRWASDGASLFYVSDAAGSNDVARVPAAGGNRAWITEDPADEFDAAPSPDGTRVAFVSNASGPTRLHIVSADGGRRASWRPVDTDDRDPGVPTGTLRGRVVGPDGRTMPARLMLRASDGRAYAEDEGFHRVVPSTRIHYQHVNGTFEIEVPAGRTFVEAMRGFEFQPGHEFVDVPANGITEVEIRLEPIDVDLSELGWYSGDMHVHDLHEGRYGLTHEDFFTQLSADGLGVANALIHMDGTKIMGRWSDLTGEPIPLSTSETILRYSQEYRGYFGHFALIGIDEFKMPMIGGVPSTPFAPDTLGLGHIDAARAEGGIAGFVHPFNGPTATPGDVGRRDLPVLAALGKADFYDVVSVASRELESAAVYYRLLNSGIRLAATGGTDNFSDVWFDASGGTARTYARLAPGEAFGFSTWIDAVRAGRTFATSGPLLFLTVGGKEPGDELRLNRDDADAVAVELDLSSIAPLDRAEIIVNGKVRETWSLSGGSDSWAFETTIDLPGSGWIAARAIGPTSRYVGDEFAFAQTSAVYVVRDDQPFTSADDAAFLAESVETTWRLALDRNLWTTAAQKDAYRAGVLEARDYYRRIALHDPTADAFAARAPDEFRVRLETSRGLIVIELHRDWAPVGVDRFYNLVRFGYYDDMRIHRVRDGEFVQFGINGDPAISKAWRDAPIADDPVVESNLRGTLAFAHGTSDDDRTSQVYINLRDKPELDTMEFAIMGRVVQGMDVADALYSGYGERAGGGIRGGRQDPVFEGGNAWLDENFPELDRIYEAGVELLEGETN